MIESTKTGGARGGRDQPQEHVIIRNSSCEKLATPYKETKNASHL